MDDKWKPIMWNTRDHSFTMHHFYSGRHFGVNIRIVDIFKKKHSLKKMFISHSIFVCSVSVDLLMSFYTIQSGFLVMSLQKSQLKRKLYSKKSNFQRKRLVNFHLFEKNLPHLHSPSALTLRFFQFSFPSYNRILMDHWSRFQF